MFKKQKKFIIGFVLGALIFGNVQVLATSGIKAINAFYNNIKITVDGKEIKTDVEPFIVDGKTYVPVRVVSEALGVNVNWNDKTNTVEIGKEQKKEEVKTLKTVAELKKFLVENYSTLDTVIGQAKFTFIIEENDTIYNPYDYRIKVYFDDTFFSEAKLSIKYTDEQKELLGKQLREHQKSMALAVIKSMPTKKFYGSYYKSSYEYPYLQIGLQETMHSSWINFTLSNLNTVIFTNYDEALITDFTWYPEFDITLPGEKY